MIIMIFKYALLQDWASIEGSLHRALASYTIKRSNANDGPRPDAVASLVVWFSSAEHATSRSGHERMGRLKQMVREFRPLKAMHGDDHLAHFLDANRTDSGYWQGSQAEGAGKRAGQCRDPGHK